LGQEVGLTDVERERLLVDLGGQHDRDVLGFRLAPQVVDEAAPTVGRQLSVDQNGQGLQLDRLAQGFLGAGGNHHFIAGVAEEGLDPLFHRGIVVGDQDHGRLGAGPDRGHHLHRTLLDAGFLLGELDQLPDVFDESLAALVDVGDELAPLFGGRLVGLLVEQDLAESEDGVER